MVLRTYLVYNKVVRLCLFFGCGGKVNFVRIPYSHDRFSKISRTFFVKKWSPIKPTYEKTNSFLRDYYYFYHGSDLRKIIRFLRENDCIEFECNEFVLVLFRIDLIHFEHPICISSTSIKTNTNPLVQLQYIPLHIRSIHTISCKIGHVIQIIPH